MKRDRAQFPNSTCQDIGHSWQRTTSDTYRICNRNGCKAAERFSRGVWIPVERRTRRKRTVLEPVATLF